MTKRLGGTGATVKAKRSFTRGFMRDEDGSFIIFGLAIFMLMVLAGGIGVDVMRYEAHRTKVQNTLDRAVLAASALDQTLDPDVVVLDYFTKAGLGHLVKSDDITWDANETERHVSVSLDLRMGTTFLRMASLEYLRFPTVSAAQEVASLSEISLVLDVSGSMGSWSSSAGDYKINALEDAAKQFVNLMLCNPTGSDANGFDWTAVPNPNDCTVENNKISINVVPYSEQVVAGEELLDYLNATQEHEERSCVVFYDDDYTSVLAGANPFPNTGLGEKPIQREAYADFYRRWDQTPYPAGNQPCLDNSSREITFMEDDLPTLFGAIEALSPEGWTAIDIGMKWGAALLDENLQAVVEEMADDNVVVEDFRGRPFNYDERSTEKVIVLMTDGINTQGDYLKEGYHNGPSGVFINTNPADTSSTDWDRRISIYDPDQDNYYWPWLDKRFDHAYGEGSYEHEDCHWVRDYYHWWYGWIYKQECTVQTVDEGGPAVQLDFAQVWEEKTVSWYEGWAWTENYINARWNYTEKNDHLKDICQAAKDEGIIVFTIGFEVNDYTQDGIMRDCATIPSYYYDVSGLNIETAFASIAREISKLRLVN